MDPKQAPGVRVTSCIPMATPRLGTRPGAWAAGAALVLALVAGFAWTRQAHARTPWSLRPERISYCDRSYQRAPTWSSRSGEEIGVSDRRPLHQVGRVPPFIGRPVLAPDSTRVDGWVGTEAPCVTAILVEVGEDRFVSYGLVGGP